MKEFGFDKELQNEKMCVFTNYYQFFREVLFSLKKGGTYTLLFDERSPVFSRHGRGLFPFLMDFIPHQYQNKIILLSVQEMVLELEQSEIHKDWIHNFKLKYGIQ